MSAYYIISTIISDCLRKSFLISDYINEFLLFAKNRFKNVLSPPIAHSSGDVCPAHRVSTTVLMETSQSS